MYVLVYTYIHTDNIHTLYIYIHTLLNDYQEFRAMRKKPVISYIV